MVCLESAHQSPHSYFKEMEANAETDDKSTTKAIIVSDLKIEFNVH